MCAAGEEFIDGKGHFGRSAGQTATAAVAEAKVWLAVGWLTAMMKRSVVFVPDATGLIPTTP